MFVGYARVSTLEQDTDLQLRHLKRAGVRKVYQEKTSSVGARPQLHKLLDEIQPGQVLTVYKLDRIARSLRDLLNILERLEATGCGIRSLSEPIDTGTPAGRLMIQMLGAVAEFERSLIRERSIAGQRAAIERGSVPGRRRSLAPELEADVVRMYDTGLWSMQMLAEVFEIHTSSVKRAIYRVHRPGHSSLH